MWASTATCKIGLCQTDFDSAMFNIHFKKRKERICSLGRLQGQSLVSRLLHRSETVSHPSGTVTQPGAKDWSGAVSMELLVMVLAPVKAYLVLGRAVDSAEQIYGN